MRKLSITIILFSLVLLTGCASYNITVDSLTAQLNDQVVNKGYLLAKESVKGNTLVSVKCIDKNGKELVLPVTNRTGVRIYTKDNSKKTFYFNTLLIKDNSIYGSKTHFVNAQIDPIKLSDIKEIEIIE